MDDRNRRAPVALPADAPVAQPPGGLLGAETLVRERRRHRIDGDLVGEAAEVVGVHRHAAARVGVPVLPVVVAEVLAVDGDHLQDVDAVFLREREVALVVRRNAHHRAVAVAHQHIVADPQVDRFAAQRVPHLQPGRQALFLAQRELGFAGAALLALLDERRELGVALRRVRGQRMLGGDGAEGHAHDRVGARREDPQLAVLDRPAVLVLDGVREGEAHAFALADPVLLHQPHALGPAVQVVRVRGVGDVGEQLVGVVGDGEVVAGDLAPLDRRAAAPAAAVDDLLVGEHRLVDRVPVHHLGLLVGNALFEHLQEEPLVPTVVVGVAGGDLARPVEREAERLHLRLHVGDVVARPFRRRHVVVDGRVLGRQPEGVPAHRHQHVEALHPQVARHHVVDGVVADVAHVQLAARVGQHRAGVELRPARVFAHPIRVGGSPGGLRGAFDLVRLEFGIHEGAPRARKGRRIIGSRSCTRPPTLRIPSVCARPCCRRGR